MTVNGPVSPEEMGLSLIHEHILVDFIGANETNPQRWNDEEVMRVVLPHLARTKAFNVNTFVDCTPAYLGRDVFLLKKIADSTGLNIITNTGYYGAVQNKYLPAHAFTESADELAQRWILEFEKGIDGTSIKPGFIKISVDSGPLSELHKKLVTAAARAHLKTGLTIASHTGLAIPAMEQLSILEEEGVAPEAFIWVHAQAEKDLSHHVNAARGGAWISLDGVSKDNLDEYIEMIRNLKAHNLLDKTLISHDAGWYSPGEENGGDYRGHTAVFEYLVPELIEEGFTSKDIDQLLVLNPARVFAIEVREK